MILAADIRPGSARLALFAPDLEPLQVETCAVADLRQLVSVVRRFLRLAPQPVSTACFAVDTTYDVYAHEIAEVLEIPAVRVVDTIEAGGRLQLEGLERDPAAVLVGAAQIAFPRTPPPRERLVQAA